MLDVKYIQFEELKKRQRKIFKVLLSTEKKPRKVCKIFIRERKGRQN